MDKILITGGAGYIGTHIVKNLLKEGFSLMVLDNLSVGFIEPIEILKKKYGLKSHSNLEFIKGDLADKNLLEKIFKKDIEAVIHLAAKTDAVESVKNPELYHRENYINSINLVEGMSSAGVNKLIFSSTAAVYGNPQYIPIDENHSTNPTNAYGQTKLDFEKYLERVENLKYIVLRYFNVGGSDPIGLIGKSHLQSEDLIENIMKVVLGQKEILQIFGSDYDTEDGTSVRDFIHVEDVAIAHILSLENLEKFSRETLPAGRQVFNLGSEIGFSVKEIIDRASLIINKEIPTQTVEKRQGDIAQSVASAQKAKEKLAWNPQYSNLDSIIRSDWNWRKKHPYGYTKGEV